jgi:hypothetical protein
MTNGDTRIGAPSAAFAMASAITILFSTALAWAKDAYKPLNSVMNAIAWHNWVTHGLADLIVFFGLGLLFSRSNWIQRMAPSRVISFLVVAVVVGGAGLFAWYALF